MDEGDSFLYPNHEDTPAYAYILFTVFGGLAPVSYTHLTLPTTPYV